MKRTTMTVQEIADYLGVSRDIIYTLVRCKSIPHVKAGKRILIRKDSVDQWMEQQEKQNMVGDQ